MPVTKYLTPPSLVQQIRTLYSKCGQVLKESVLVWSVNFTSQIIVNATKFQSLKSSHRNDTLDAFNMTFTLNKLHVNVKLTN